jgi:hypothetical protein
VVWRVRGECSPPGGVEVRRDPGGWLQPGPGGLREEAESGSLVLKEEGWSLTLESELRKEDSGQNP